MDMTNKEIAALLRDVADKIEDISDKSKTGRKKFLKQFERIPIPIEEHQKSLKAFIDGFTGKKK